MSSETPPRIPPPAPGLVTAALAHLLRPIVRLLIRAGVTFPDLSDLLRELYVSVAENDFALSGGKPQTDSRVSLITGIHRKEVHRLRGAGARVNAVPTSVTRGTQIVTRWSADPAFLDAERKPLPLPRVSGAAGGPSFESLVESVTRDVRPRAVLDELVNEGVVGFDAEGRIVLLEAAFVPRPGGEQQLYYFARNLHDHIAASVDNVLGAEARFFERAVHYDKLSLAATDRLLRKVGEAAMDVLVDVNREALEVAEADKGGPWRWIMGVYVFREEAKDDNSSPGAAALPETEE
jgi:Family of unknown function (DUF6502)